MKLIRTEDAAGCILCHDMTRIVRGVSKGPVFKKGHVVTEEDIPVLLSIGKDNIYVWEKDDTLMHEDEAAEVLCSLCLNDFMERSEASEGKIEIRASRGGLLKVNSKALKLVNGFGQMMIATRYGNFPVKEGDKLAGTRIIPLVIEKEKMEELSFRVHELTEGEPILELKPIKEKKAGIVTTGNEVYYGRIEDTFTPVVEEKLAEYGSRAVMRSVCPDDAGTVTSAILDMIRFGCEIVLVTGGMSVDPDDRTPLAIRNTGADIVSYGAPALPGAMFLLSYYRCSHGHDIPVMGLPGCVMYSGRTVFDLVLPRVLADDAVAADELSSLGEGGLCLGCGTCTFPNCGFGKGK